MKKFVELVRNNVFKDIYVPGFLYMEDDGMLEFNLHLHYLYLQFGKKYIEVEMSMKLGKFRLTMVDSVQNHLEMVEDTQHSRCRIGDIIFKEDTSFVSNRVEWMRFYGLEIAESELICDAFHIKLKNEQDLFLAPLALGIEGINIGGLEVERDWLEHLEYGGITVPQVSTIDFREGC